MLRNSNPISDRAKDATLLLVLLAKLHLCTSVGVGQVVLQVAASTHIKLAYGVEKAETPCMYAKAMDEEFQRYLAWYGKTCSEYLLEQGNFLENDYSERINKAE